MPSAFPDFRPPLDPQPLWKQLARELRERIRPAREPELHLESKPIPVKDIWSLEHQTGKRLGSIAVHAVVVGILLLPFWKPVRMAVHHTEVTLMPTLLAPGPSLPKMKHLASGGAPRVHQLLPPKLMPVNAPPQPITPPIKLLPATAMANVPIPSFGDPGRLVGPPGNNAGNSGAGPGGAGDDPNGGGNCVSGTCAIGGDVSEPVLVYDPDPEYSDAARKAKYQGTVVVAVLIGADGHVYDPRVIQPLGLGLDQKALEAVKLWRFEPAKKHGQAVRVAANIEVNFRLY
ncbi:MAG TPA: TonB family protein [Terriglobales bacterium]|nr:TonB family protein [Terriglobales bacterium]